jgi:hypothetical protein
VDGDSTTFQGVNTVEFHPPSKVESCSVSSLFQVRDVNGKYETIPHDLSRHKCLELITDVIFGGQ